MQLYFLDIIQGRRKGLFPTLLRPILLVASLGFQLISFVRNWLFDHQYLPETHSGAPLTISIGNIVAGGTGKTPTSLYLAQEFYHTFPLAILSRGCGSPAEKRAVPVFLSKGAGPLFPARECGDEPYLLSQALPNAYVVVGRNKRVAAKMAVDAGAQIILIDDGMQHRYLARDFNIVVMDANTPFGYGYFLPRGLLRDSPHSLKRADLMILNGVQNEAQYQDLQEKISKYTNAPVIAAKLEANHLYSLNGSLIPSISSSRVGIFSGIAHPERFRKTVEELGANVMDECIVPDHHSFSKEKLARFAKKCKKEGADLLLCTEKDRVKLNDDLQLDLPVAWLQVRLKITHGKTQWEQFIAKAKAMLTKLEKN